MGHQNRHRRGGAGFLITNSDDARIVFVDVVHEGGPEALAGAKADGQFIADTRTCVDLLWDAGDRARAQLIRAQTPRRRTRGGRLRLRNRAEM
ncbi:hypothetical protein ACWZEH_14455 [Streptomyces sp. QTS137]